MKMKYVKPALTVESFTLTQSIAHNCGKALDFSQATLKEKTTCGWDMDGIKGGDVIWVSAPACTEGSLTDLDQTGAGVCYNNPDGGFNIFNS